MKSEKRRPALARLVFVLDDGTTVCTRSSKPHRRKIAKRLAAKHALLSGVKR